MDQNSSTTKSCKVISKLLLPEDLMFHILTLVPLTSLFNSARYVCKPWAVIIASSLFAEACERRARSKLGLYVQNCTTTTSSYFLEFKDDVNGEFERIDLGTPQAMGRLIDTCHGILLLSNDRGEIFVVNPILKCWLRIPHFPNSLPYTVARCRYTVAHVPSTSKFKLFLLDGLDVSGAFWIVIYVLRIGIDNSWKEIARKEAPRYWNFSGQQLFTGDNDLYWIARKEVIVIDVDKEIILQEYPLLDVPNGLVRKYLWMGNRLSVIVYENFYRTYQIFILDFDSGKWSLHHEMGPFDYMTACGHEVNIRSVVFRFWISNQIIFHVARRQNQIGNTFPGKNNMHFSYNFKTRQLTKIEKIDVGNFEVWLHTNSLVSLSSTSA